MPGHIDSPQSFATVNWIGVRLLGRLAAVALVVVLVFAGMMTAPPVVEFVGALVTLVTVMFQGLIVTLPVVMLNGTMVEFVAVMFHGLMVRFPIVLFNGGTMECTTVMLTGSLLLGAKAEAAARRLKSDSDRTAPLASLPTESWLLLLFGDDSFGLPGGLLSHIFQGWHPMFVARRAISRMVSSGEAASMASRG
jgi:hypothetical protein